MFKTPFRLKKIPKGFTLLEFMGVLLLAAGLIFIVLRQQHASTVRGDANKIITSMQFAQQKASATFTPTYAAMTCPALANNAGFAGTTFRIDRSAGVNVYYNEDPSSLITCAPATLFGTNDAFAITLPAMTNDLCAEVIDQLGTLAWKIDVNGVNVKPPRGALDPAAKGVQCTAAGTNDLQSVAITMSRQAAPQ